MTAHLFDPGPTVADHPAKFNDAILGIIARHLESGWSVFDPFAGRGGIHRLRWLVPGVRTHGCEIEPRWAAAHPDTVCADLFDVDHPTGAFDVIVTSCAYGNRMADTYDADGSYRRTYQHAYGQALHPNNAGLLNWGKRYRTFHQRAWEHVTPWARARFVLNVKDHIRGRKPVPVVAWHISALTLLGWHLDADEELETHGFCYGANGDDRLPEHVLVFTRTVPVGVGAKKSLRPGPPDDPESQSFLSPRNVAKRAVSGG